MKLKYIMKTLLIEINRTVTSFLAITLMLAVSFALLLFETTTYADYIYRMMYNQSVLSVKSSQLYIINTEYYKIFWTEEETKNYYDFIVGLNNKKEGICSGLYYTSYLNSEELLCISKELISIGKLEDVDGKAIEFTEKNSVAVGYELRDRYPIGSIISDKEHGVEYRVSQILKQNSEWLANSASVGIQPSINLDNFICMDAGANLEANGYINILNASNNSYLYHPTMEKQEADTYIQEYAKSMGIRVYDTISLQEKSKRRLSYAYNSQSVEMLFAINSFLLSVVGQYLAVIINLEYRKQTFGVLLTCKWTKRDVCRMSFMECTLRLILSLCIAIPVSYFAVKNMLGGTASKVFYWVLPVLVLALIINLACNSLIDKKISGYQIKELLGRGNRK